MKNENETKYISFNQDYTCITLVTESGYRVFNTHPLQYFYRRGKFHLDFSESFSIVELLYRSNIVAIVGSNNSQRYRSSNIIIWDDQQLASVGELCFNEEIKALKLRRDYMAVVMQNIVYVYNMVDLKLRDIVPTCENPRGLSCFNTNSEKVLLACPDKSKGRILIKLKA